MKNTAILASAAAAAALFTAAASASAQPHGHQHQHQHQQKRDVAVHVEWVTETETVTEIIGASATSWIFPSSADAGSASSAIPAASSGAANQPAAVKSSTTLSTVVHTTPSAASVSSPAAPAPAPAASSSSGAADSSKSSAGQTYSGDITYYTVGLGACGENQTGDGYTEDIVALSHDMMGPESNNNPYCGRKIQIQANGKTTTATVSDKCMGCDTDSIDVSKKVFIDLWGGLAKGRGPCTWSFID